MSAEGDEAHKPGARMPFLWKVDDTIKAAVASGGGVMLLFHSVLKALVPPISDAELALGLVAFFASVMLMALSLLIRTQFRVLRQMVLGCLSLALLVVAIAVFFVYRDRLEDVVYELPDQTKHVCGQFYAGGAMRSVRPSQSEAAASTRVVSASPEGRACARRPSIASEVMRSGGADVVEKHALLWDPQSKRDNASMLLGWYMFLSLLLTTSIYIAAIAVARETRYRKGDSQ